VFSGERVGFHKLYNGTIEPVKQFFATHLVKVVGRLTWKGQYVNAERLRTNEVLKLWVFSGSHNVDKGLI
jgi:hypothetical protein